MSLETLKAKVQQLIEKAQDNAWMQQYLITPMNPPTLFKSNAVIESIPQIDTSMVTDFSNMFNGCRKLLEITVLNTERAVNMQSMFEHCEMMTAIPVLCTDEVTNMNRTFLSCWKLKEVHMGNTSKITGLSNAFGECDNLETIMPAIDASNVTTFSGIFCFYRCGKLINISFVPNTIRVSLGFPQSTKLSDASIQSILDGLAEVEAAQTLTFSSTVGTKLTEEQKAAVTAKNWTLAY